MKLFFLEATETIPGGEAKSYIFKRNGIFTNRDELQSCDGYKRESTVEKMLSKLQSEPVFEQICFSVLAMDF